MDDEKHAHRCADPFVCCLAPKLIAHEKKQRQRHQNVCESAHTRIVVHLSYSFLRFMLCKDPADHLLVVENNVCSSVVITRNATLSKIGRVRQRESEMFVDFFR